MYKITQVHMIIMQASHYGIKIEFSTDRLTLKHTGVHVSKLEAISEGIATALQYDFDTVFVYLEPLN